MPSGEKGTNYGQWFSPNTLGGYYTREEPLMVNNYEWITRNDVNRPPPKEPDKSHKQGAEQDGGISARDERLHKLEKTLQEMNLARKTDEGPEVPHVVHIMEQRALAKQNAPPAPPPMPDHGAMNALDRLLASQPKLESQAYGAHSVCSSVPSTRSGSSSVGRRPLSSHSEVVTRTPKAELMRGMQRMPAQRAAPKRNAALPKKGLDYQKVMANPELAQALRLLKQRAKDIDSAR